MTSTNDHDLAALGDALERAARRSLRPRRNLLRVAVAAVAVGAVAAGAAVASGVFSADRVASGMPAGSMLFGGTSPHCTLDGDGITYRCTLSSRPTEEVLGDYLDSKELVTIDDRIAGGCIGRDHEGLRWDCYLGDEAVRRGILVHDLLGQRSYGPSRG